MQIVYNFVRMKITHKRLKCRELKCQEAQLVRSSLVESSNVVSPYFTLSYKTYKPSRKICGSTFTFFNVVLLYYEMMLYKHVGVSSIASRRLSGRPR